MERWSDIIKGLPSEEKLKLLKRYPTPQNCTSCEPPKLNAEIRRNVQDATINRDTRIFLKQTSIATCIFGNAEVMQILLKQERLKDNCKILEILDDVYSLLTDLQHNENKVRRSLIIVNYSNNSPLQNTLSETKPDSFLFGNKLEETLKNAKAKELSSRDLRPCTINQLIISIQKTRKVCHVRRRNTCRRWADRNHISGNQTVSIR